MFAMRGRRYVVLGLLIAVVTVMLLVTDSPSATAHEYLDKYLDRPNSSSKAKGKAKDKAPPKPKYLPEPDWTPPPVKDPFPQLLTSDLPPIPAWNRPKPGLHKDYGIGYAPPLFIGFTRTWPLLLQAVVSYVTAGWPPEQIYVVENTGVQGANARGELTLQNPFYLGHRQLARLGVNVIEAPVLMSFAQMQNYFMYLSREHEAPYYFWSHMDVLALSYEEGMKGYTPKATEPGYKTVYELSLAEMNRSMHTTERWAHRFFAYDHLTLVNRAAYEDVGGWDTLIPYYMTDCDMHSRLLMANWTQKDVKAGIIIDVSTSLSDLRALYRDETVEPDFTDPNPPVPKKEDGKGKREVASDEAAPRLATRGDGDGKGDDEVAPQIAYWKKIWSKGDTMWHYKHADRGRNTWQIGQKGGQGEPFYYPARGIEKGIDVVTEAGKEVFRQKWGHRDCDLLTGAGLQTGDEWRVAKDW